MGGLSDASSDDEGAIFGLAGGLRSLDVASDSEDEAPRTDAGDDALALLERLEVAVLLGLRDAGLARADALDAAGDPALARAASWARLLLNGDGAAAGLAAHLDAPGRGKAAFAAAADFAGVRAELVGALGKRTKYQRTSLPQLALATAGQLAARRVAALEALRDSHAATRADAPAESRAAFAHAVDYPSTWELDREVGGAMAALGAFATAAEHFAKIHEWDRVVECFAASGKRERALARDPRPARSLGRRASAAGDWAAAAAWFDKALAARPQAPESWFNLGCARMKLAERAADGDERDVELDAATRAFSRCATQEPDCGDAWANIAACKLRRRDFAGARSALEAAARTRAAKGRQRRPPDEAELEDDADGADDAADAAAPPLPPLREEDEEGGEDPPQRPAAPGASVRAMLRRPARVAVVALASRSAGFAAPRRRRFGGALSRWVGAAAGGERDPGEVGGLRIVAYPHPALRARNGDLAPGDLAAAAPLAARMFDLMYAAGGVGLAAPQLEVGSEGCLSFPGMGGPVARHAWVEVAGLDLEGRAISRAYAGWDARVFQHEYDHLDGVVYVDRLAAADRAALAPALRELAAAYGPGGDAAPRAAPPPR
ncbi:peptide deformylase [Aureococcus anophagefferens]|nr:peptide deformylase [Aureococcus anophagefferens]